MLKAGGNIEKTEDVARGLFSPKLITPDGYILPRAFMLNPNSAEDYISVALKSEPSWLDDIKKIPEHKNRKLYGYCTLNVGDIIDGNADERDNAPVFDNVCYEVKSCTSADNVSHCGIYISVDGKLLLGNSNPEDVDIPEGKTLDDLTLFIYNHLLSNASEPVRVERD